MTRYRRADFRTGESEPGPAIAHARVAGWRVHSFPFDSRVIDTERRANPNQLKRRLESLSGCDIGRVRSRCYKVREQWRFFPCGGRLEPPSKVSKAQFAFPARPRQTFKLMPAVRREAAKTRVTRRGPNGESQIADRRTSTMTPRERNSPSERIE